MTENVNFRPTKRLFIDVLTQDISLKDCILDLLDNSVDSYTKNKIAGTGEISLTISPNSFQIFDSCGGISKPVLLNEVFRFGMSDFSNRQNTIGVYGIGLKRAIFKIGRDIIFETDNGKEYCKLHINVQDWLKDEDEWSIPLSDIHTSTLNGNEPYTRISITDLRDEAKDLFRTTAFAEDIKSIISTYYSMFINRGKIVFKTNKETITGYEVKIFASDDYKPVKHEESFDNVNIQIICWLHISEARTQPSGWNVYMNDRLVLFNDTSEDSGWRGEKTFLPQYHNIYNQFRGIVFLSTDEPFKLPMNTSKNEFSKDSTIYHHLIAKMCEVARPFINYLGRKYNAPKTDIDETEDKLSNNISEDSKSQQESLKESSLSETSYETSFTPPPVRTMPKKDTSIQYSKPKERVDIVKKLLKAKTNWEVGSETFEYFWDSEGLDDYE